MIGNSKGLTRPPDFNPVGLKGLEFIEYASPEPQKLAELFKKFGFTLVGCHKHKNVELYRQRSVNFILNLEPASFAEEFRTQHGASICATGFRVNNAQEAFKVAVERGGRPCTEKGHRFAAIYGIGDSLVYFVDENETSNLYEEDFNFVDELHQKGFGLMATDHLTNNVPQGKMEDWCSFYREVFNFREVRYFDIQGSQTGLISKVMRSPCNQITIPINEPTDSKSQIQEYLDEYKGAGIQHLALLTSDICKSVGLLKEQGIEFLDVPETYYEALPKRLPNIKENIEELRSLKILADGDEDGYLLQIFTKNLIGPIFIEIIQRHNHDGFGEGNFQALFDAIELDQKQRGYL